MPCTARERRQRLSPQASWWVTWPWSVADLKLLWVVREEESAAAAGVTK